MQVLTFSSLSDRGRVRENNEDAVHVDGRLALGVLADGMGGYNAGEVASAMATAQIATELGSRSVGWGKTPQYAASMNAVVKAVQNASNAIWAAAQAHPPYNGMGTTVVVALFQHARLLLAHVGDSRAYLWRSGQLLQLTRDHSYLQEQIDAGMISADEAFTAPHRNLVTRALGVEPTVEVEIHGHDVFMGDLYLLCSDGLTDMLPDTAIAALLAEGGSLDDTAARLINAANAEGGRDNISVILVRA